MRVVNNANIRANPMMDMSMLQPNSNHVVLLTNDQQHRGAPFFVAQEVGQMICCNAIVVGHDSLNTVSVILNGVSRF